MTSWSSFGCTLTFIFVIAGCAAPSKKPIRADYVTGLASPETKSDAIKAELKRGNNSYGHYWVEVYPYTKTLIETEENETGIRNMDAKETIRKRIESRVSPFVDQKTCFFFTIATFALEGSRFNNWLAKVDSPNGEMEPVVFTNLTGADSVPTPVQNSMTGFPWHNASLGCSKKINLEKGFKIHVIPQLDTDAPTTVLEWQAAQ